MILASREVAARMTDQARARALFSCSWVAAYALTDGALWLVNRRSQLIVDLSMSGMSGILFLAMLQGVYMQVLGLPAWARLASSACSVALFATLPAPWSELGQPWEAVGLCGAHVLGEVFLLTNAQAEARRATRAKGM